MNDDLLVQWSPVSSDIGGQPANVLGYRIFDMTDPLTPVQVADVTGTSHTLLAFVTDPNNPPPIAVAAYNAVGEGAKSQTVVAQPPSASIPEQVTGVTAVIIPK